MMMVRDTSGFDWQAGFINEAKVSLEWSLVPRRCQLTGKILFLSKAYKATVAFKAPGADVVLTKWYDRDSFLIFKLREGRQNVWV